MNIVWFSWKDINHPQAGGAETISWNIMVRLARAGHDVKLLTSRYEGSSETETLEGVEIIRHGGKLGVYFRAFLYFRRRLAKWPDLIIDEMNTLAFASGFYSRKKRILLTYQLAREVWLFQAVAPFSYIGYWLEPVYLFLLSLRYKTVLTESESTRLDLARFGFSKANTHVFRVGMDLQPLDTLDKKETMDQVLVLGAMRAMKQTLSAVKGFELARDKNPALSLTLAGSDSGSYASKVKQYIASSRHAEAIKVVGRVSDKQRVEAMRQATVILVTSVKEGWGLIVTEANSQGTPAIAFDCDGLRDSVKDNQTGLLVKSGDEAALGDSINKLLANKTVYETMRVAAWEDSKQYTFDISFSDFVTMSKIDKK